MAETDLHWQWMVTITERLKRYFAKQRVYVASDLLIYYEEDNPRKSVAPDAFVVLDCKPGNRDIFQIWKERRTPNFTLETTSKTTRREDRIKKKEVYAQIGVAEYFLYDPRQEWLKPPLQGYRLAKGDYDLIPPDADAGIVSEQLGVRFVLESGALAMFSSSTGERLLSGTELADELERRLHEATEARKSMEKELAQLRESGKKANGPKRKNAK